MDGSELEAQTAKPEAGAKTPSTQQARFSPPTVPEVLAQAHAEMSAKRGRDWAHERIAPGRSALVAIGFTNAAMAALPRMAQLATKAAWIAETLRATGGRAAWVRCGADLYTDAMADVAGAAAAAEGRNIAQDPARGGLSPHVGAQRGDLHVKTRTESPFFPGASMLPHLLRDAGVDTIIVAGAESDGAVLATCFDGFAAGFRVIAAWDCCAGSSLPAHDAAMAAIHRKTGDARAAQDVVAALRRG